MRVRFILSHPESGTSQEISEPDGWLDSELKLDRHETFHSLVEYFDGSFILYGNNGVVDGGIDFVKNIIRNYGIDTTIEIVIDITFDEITFENIFTGQLGIADKEELENNKMRIPIIRDDFWAKFIARLDTPVNIQSGENLDDQSVGASENVLLALSSQVIQASYRSIQKESTDVFWDDETTHPYLQVDLFDEEISEIEEKFSIPFAFNVDKPVNLIYVTYAGEYTFDIEYNFTWMFADPDTLDRGLFNTEFILQMYIQINEDTPIQFSGQHFGNNAGSPTGNDRYSKYTYTGTLNLKAGDKVFIYGEHQTIFPYPNSKLALLGNESGVLNWDGIEPNGGTDVNFALNGQINTHFTISADTVFPESNHEGFLLHDVAASITDRTIGEENTLYSEILGSEYTRSRQYWQNGCAWTFALLKGLQLRGYSLTEKSFFMSFNDWWRGADPILNLSLGYETVMIPHVIDVSPDINLIADLADWENEPGATWDFATYGQPFVSVNGNGGLEGYAAGAAPFDAGQEYFFETGITVHETGASVPIVKITWAILDNSFNELVTKEFSYSGSGDKYQDFVLVPPSNGAYFGVKIENNTPFDTKNFEVFLAFSEFAQIEYTSERVIRIEEKRYQYDDSDGTSVDFSFVKTITSKYDNDRIWNKVNIGYTKWESEDISGLDDPQSKRTLATRFKKVGKGIDLYSEFIAASLAIEKTRRTTREKSADYKYDNETFIISINPTEVDESPQSSPDVLAFEPELDENYSSVTNLRHPETRYNLDLTPMRNFLRWRDYLQGPLQSYIGSSFKFTSGDGNYSMTSVKDDSCLNDGYEGNELAENGDILVTNDYVHLPDLYEVEHPMDWSEYLAIRNNRRKPIGISLTDTDHVPMFIKTLSYKPMEGKFTAILWAKEPLDLTVPPDTMPMRECFVSAEECEDALTDEDGEILTNELGVCITE